MNRKRTITVAALLLIAAFASSVFALRQVERVRGKEATLEEVLYIPSGKTLKHMSLGYSGLLADVYWTRAVQYFGSRLHHSERYDLLGPLLDITTDLDPHLIVAYETGAVFLSQAPPYGAGQSDKAVALLEKGIRENPKYWHLYFTLGFVHYVDRHDYRAAEKAFEKGSEVPGALGWMKAMAAKMAEKGADIETAILLWKGIYETTYDATVRDTALKHILSLQADAQMEELEHRIQSYRERTGTLPTRWSDLIRAGLLPGIPLDPTGDTYNLLPEGTVTPKDLKKFPFLGQVRSGK